MKYYTSIDNIESKLDKADTLSEISDKRLEHNEVFKNVRNAVIK